MNNPVNMSDPDGNWLKWATKLVAAVAVVAVAAVVAAITVATAGAGTAAAVIAVGWIAGAVLTVEAVIVIYATVDVVSNEVIMLAKKLKTSGKEIANDVPSWANRGMISEEKLQNIMPEK